LNASPPRTSNISGSAFINKAAGFDSPTQLPRDEEQHSAWQAANFKWWQSSPMRYDWRDGIACQPGTKVYFEEIDRRFFKSAHAYMPWRDRPFEKLIPFEELRCKDVLEIGVGQGSHAQLIAPFTKSFTGIDLTDFAVDMTAKRLEIFGIAAAIRQTDAEQMDFPDSSFDYVWSWGVIHHSADTRRALREIHRVLRSDGSCTVMVYHRSWWNYYVLYGFLKGILQGKLRDESSIHHVSQTATDGAIARYYTPGEWRAMVEEYFSVEWIQIFGLKAEVIPLPHGRIKRFLERIIPDGLTRLFTNRLRMGSFLVAHMRKI
jgi:ubiquinone/menaquinone biosynthesis C-methylase UbiE